MHDILLNLGNSPTQSPEELAKAVEFLLDCRELGGLRLLEAIVDPDPTVRKGLITALCFSRLATEKDRSWGLRNWEREDGTIYPFYGTLSVREDESIMEALVPVISETIEEGGDNVEILLGLLRTRDKNEGFFVPFESQIYNPLIDASTPN